MEPVTIGILCIIGVIVLMFAGIPIPFAMALCGTIGVCLIKSPTAAIQLLSSDMMKEFSSYSLTVGPIFGLMGYFAYYSGLGGDLFKTINYMCGHKKGGLAMATQLACTGFGAICGSATATTATMCAVAYPEMRKYGYAPQLAGPGLVVGGTIACLIPPSSTFVIYGSATGTSIGALFMGGIGAGLLMTLCGIGVIWVLCKIHPEYAPASPKHTWKEVLESCKSGGIIEVAIIFVLSIGGMSLGWFTPTEAGAVGSVGLFIMLLVRRKINFKQTVQSLCAAARMMAMIYLLLGCAQIFSRMFTMSTIPALIGNWVANLEISPYIVLGIIIIIYVVLGAIADLMAMLLLTLPMFYPIVVDTLGYSPVWFGVICTIMLGIGGLTPPVGNGIYAVSTFTKWDKETSVAKLFVGSVPFVIAMLVCVVILVFLPQIVTWIPSLSYTV